jgi:hypothetical protein
MIAMMSDIPVPVKDVSSSTVRAFVTFITKMWATSAPIGMIKYVLKYPEVSFVFQIQKSQKVISPLLCVFGNIAQHWNSLGI